VSPPWGKALRKSFEVGLTGSSSESADEPVRLRTSSLKVTMVVAVGDGGEVMAMMLCFSILERERGREWWFASQKKKKNERRKLKLVQNTQISYSWWLGSKVNALKLKKKKKEVIKAFSVYEP
jgi:hypothetical protein